LASGGEKVVSVATRALERDETLAGVEVPGVHRKPGDRRGGGGLTGPLSGGGLGEKLRGENGHGARSWAKLRDWKKGKAWRNDGRAKMRGGIRRSRGGDASARSTRAAPGGRRRA